MPCIVGSCRVLVRILKLPVKNSNSKISAHPDLATQLLQIHIPNTFNSRLCQKGQFSLITPKKSKLKILLRNICLPKKEAFRKLLVQKTDWMGQVLATSLSSSTMGVLPHYLQTYSINYIEIHNIPPLHQSLQCYKCPLSSKEMYASLKHL